MKIKQVGFYATGAIPGLHHVRCESLVGSDSNLGMLVDGVVSFNGIVYPITTSTDDVHTFHCIDDTTGMPSDGLAGANLGIHLEFRRYLC
jgi:hypothetical protein